MLIKASLFCLDAVGLFNFIQRFEKFKANGLGLGEVRGISALLLIWKTKVRLSTKVS